MTPSPRGMSGPSTVFGRRRLTRYASAYIATAAAAATLSESMPCAIGICTIVSAAAIASGREPVALGAEHERDPLGRGRREVAQVDGILGQRERGDVEAGCREQLAACDAQSPTRVHGTCSTVPIETRIARR